MTQFGFSLMCELHHPNDLVEQAKRAEAAGFDFITISDHYHPWLYSHDHSPFAWSVLGALAAVTERIELVSLVTARSSATTRRSSPRRPPRSQAMTTTASTWASAPART